jgi:hypothetical protein
MINNNKKSSKSEGERNTPKKIDSTQRSVGALQRGYHVAFLKAKIPR